MILSLDDLRGMGGVLAHGCFDLVHISHIRLLRDARRACGGPLTVTITGDRHISKGPGRPAFTAAVRAEWLDALRAVDYVAIVDEPTAVSAILTIRPRVYVKGGEYRARGLFQAEIDAVHAVGGMIGYTSVYPDDVSSGAILSGDYLRQRIEGACRGSE